MKKLIFNLFFILCLLFAFSYESFASGTTILKYFREPDLNSKLEFETASSQIYTVLRTFGLVLAVCIMVTIAISYMISTPNKRAILKERLAYYFAGVIFLVAGIGFLGWYEGVAKDIASTVTNGGSSTNTTFDDDHMTASDFKNTFTDEETEETAKDFMEDPEKALDELDPVEIANLMNRLEGLEGDTEDLDISYLLDNFDRLDKTVKKELLDRAEGESTLQSKEWMTKAQKDLQDWYTINELGKDVMDGWNWGEPETWSEDEVDYMKENHRWYYYNYLGLK